MAHIVILGAGPTGLSTAYHLEQYGFSDYLIFEKEQQPGGLCRSVTTDGFTYDFTGHLLHINDPYVHSFFNRILDFQEFNTIKRKSYIFSHNVYSTYPFQCNLYGLPAEVISSCIEGFVTRKKTKKTARSFHQWVLYNFGRGLGTHFFFPYQKKIFSYDLRKISASWTGRFVPKTTLKTIISGALQENNDDIGYNAQFFYPRQGGIQFWINKLTKKLTIPPHYGYNAYKIDVKNRIIYFRNGHQEPFKHLITTIPLDNLLDTLEEPTDSFCKSAHSKLICNSVININLGIARESLSEKHWIYFPEKTYPFYRIGFYHNFSKNLVPTGCSSLYAEFSYLKHSRSSTKKNIDISMRCIKKLLNVKNEEIINEKIMDISHAYVIYNHWRDKNIADLLKKLSSNHVYSIGRYGAWKYSSMQEAILDGKNIAEHLVKQL